MIALIVKELRYYAYQRIYRRIQFVILCLLAFIFLAAAFELFAKSQRGAQISVGYDAYSILLIAFFIALLCFTAPLQGIEAIQIENQASNFDLLNMTPLDAWEILAGKLIGSLMAALWSICLAIPLFWLSAYTGGLAPQQLFVSGLVFIAGNTLFLMIGICFTLFGDPAYARPRSYALVLLITFLPLIVPYMFTFDARLLNLLRIFSPLCALLSIISDPSPSIGGAPLWLWAICLYLILSALIFWIAVKWSVRK